MGKGEYTLLTFWASWSTPCQQEFEQTLKPLYEEYHDKGLDFIGIAVGDTRMNHHEAVDDLGIAWLQIFDLYSTAAQLYGIASIPESVLITPDGTILARNLKGERVREAIETLYQKNINPA